MCNDSTEVPYKIKEIDEILPLRLGEIKAALNNEKADVFKLINNYINEYVKETLFRRRYGNENKSYYNYLVYRELQKEGRFIKDKNQKEFLDWYDEKETRYWLVGKSVKVYRIVAETWLDNTVNGKVRNCVHHIITGKGPELNNLIWLTEEEHRFIHSK